MAERSRKSEYIPLGVVRDRQTVGIFTKTKKNLRSKFFIVWSKDSLHFRVTAQEVIIILPNGKRENPNLCSNFKFTNTDSGWIVTYVRSIKNKKHAVVAIGKSLYELVVESAVSIDADGVSLVDHRDHDGNYLMYLDGLFMHVAHSKTLRQWHKESALLITSRAKYFDSGDISVMGSVNTQRGVVVFYDASYKVDDNFMLQAGAVLFSHNEPWKVLWRGDVPAWNGLVHEEHGSDLYPLGITAQDATVTFYWGTLDGAIISATVGIPFQVPVIVHKEHLYLKKSPKNPILEPKNHHDWESEAVFNPAAIYDDGKIHLLYRAIGHNGVSVLGYASSHDGVNFDRRLSYPVYEPTESNGGLPHPKKNIGPKVHSHLLYSSGGGWSGFEDPRAVKIGNRIYVTYLAFGGWDSMRMAITSISKENFDKHNWKWSKPRFISPPGEVHKNWVLFPEKINGKFAILHSISPKILVHYADSLSEFDGNTFIKSHAPYGGRSNYWDNKMRGAGPPPLKTELGWLLLYHANDSFDPNKYKLGAMILDKDNPEKILYRTSHPILYPDMPYENEGKPGVVYASGAIIKDDKLYVYYGGGDRVVCVATSPLDSFLESIKKDKEFHFEPVNTTAMVV